MTQELIDPRGPRFTASITAIVLAIALITQSWIPVAIQLVQFAVGGFISPKKAPYGVIFIKFIQPRISKDFVGEPINGPRFAQKVGLLFAAIGLIGILIHSKPIFEISISFALAAAFLNAAFNFCLGCEIYLLGQRLLKR